MKTTLIITLCMLATTFVSGQNQNAEADPSERIIQLNTTIAENRSAITFKWNEIPGNFNIEIYRKEKNSSSWGSFIKQLSAKTTEFTDDNIEPGNVYEYAIKAKYLMPVETYVSAGIECTETENRGKIIFLVDSSFVDDLKGELTRFESDLVGDGWEVLRKDIARDASVKYVKSVILDFYNSDPENVNSVFLFGHIPVPYTGTKAYDGHVKEHDGAWPADMYYGDLNEKLWTDNSVSCTTAIRNENRNIPGDGKFDVCILPASEIISLAVGRVDFYNLPAFPQSEAELLRNYLNKNHAFRHKINDPKFQALVDDNFGIIDNSGSTEAFAISGWRNFSALLNFQNIKQGDLFTDTKDDSYIWSYACGPGSYTSSKGIGTTADFVNQSPKTVFTAIYGSWFGDWDTENNFMRAALASNGWILTSCWAGRPQYTFHQMGMGATIGECVRATQNNLNNSYYFSGQTNRGTHTSLLGDPSLRIHIVQPANSLRSSIIAYKAIMLRWNQANDSIIGYYVYKLDKPSNKYIRITNSPVAETHFVDFLPNVGENYYMVRALKLSKVTSGSYYNLSQGIFDTINYKQTVPVQIARLPRLFKSGEIQSTETSNEINTEEEVARVNESTTEVADFTNETLIYPNPSTGLFNISFGSVPVQQAMLKIFNIQGKLLREETFQNTTHESFDIGTLPKGIYIVSGIIDNKKMVTRISLQ